MSRLNFINAEEVGVRNPTLKTKINHFSTYVEQTSGFPQLPNARGELMFLAVRQVKVKSALLSQSI